VLVIGLPGSLLKAFGLFAFQVQKPHGVFAADEIKIPFFHSPFVELF
jgi:hypothetical protein